MSPHATAFGSTDLRFGYGVSGTAFHERRFGYGVSGTAFRASGWVEATGFEVELLLSLIGSTN